MTVPEEHVVSTPSRAEIADLLRILRLLEKRLPREHAKEEDEGPSKSPAMEYLKSAASVRDTSTPPFSLDVVDSEKATHDQWKIIGSYLKQQRASQVEGLKGEEGGILVDWDEGQALRTEDSVISLLDRLDHEKGSGQGSSSSWSDWWSSATSTTKGK